MRIGARAGTLDCQRSFAKRLTRHMPFGNEKGIAQPCQRKTKPAVGGTEALLHSRQSRTIKADGLGWVSGNFVQAGLQIQQGPIMHGKRRRFSQSACGGDGGLLFRQFALPGQYICLPAQRQRALSGVRLYRQRRGDEARRFLKLSLPVQRFPEQ